MTLQISRDGNQIKVVESIPGPRGAQPAYWYFDLVAQLHSWRGHEGEKPSQPMTEETFDWVRHQYLPAIANQAGLLPPPEQDPLWKQRELAAHAYWFAFLQDPSRQPTIEHAESVATALLGWSGAAMGRAIREDPVYVYCECPSDWTPRAGIAFIAESFGLNETQVLARVGIVGTKRAHYEALQDAWTHPLNPITPDRQRSAA